MLLAGINLLNKVQTEKVLIIELYQIKFQVRGKPVCERLLLVAIETWLSGKGMGWLYGKSRV